jgi:hypothetical protein
MYLGGGGGGGGAGGSGGGGGGGGRGGGVVGDPHAPPTSKFWSKLKSGVKSKFLVDARTQPGARAGVSRRQSFHVTSGANVSAFRTNMMNTLSQAEGYVHARSNSMTGVLRTPLSAKDESFFTSKIERLEKELAAMREQKESETERLLSCRNDLVETNAKRQEAEFQRAEVASRATLLETRVAGAEARVEQLEQKRAAAEAAAKAGATQAKELADAVRTGEAQIAVSHGNG